MEGLFAFNSFETSHDVILEFTSVMARKAYLKLVFQNERNFHGEDFLVETESTIISISWSYIHQQCKTTSSVLKLMNPFWPYQSNHAESQTDLIYHYFYHSTQRLLNLTWNVSEKRRIDQTVNYSHNSSLYNQTAILKVIIAKQVRILSFTLKRLSPSKFKIIL